MQLLLYEYLTGGGLWSASADASGGHPLLAEGRAMVRALRADLARIEGVRLIEFQDSRFPSESVPQSTVVAIASRAQERVELARWSRRSDGVILIAPETAGCLGERAAWVEQSQGRLLSPDPAFIRLTSDKSATAQMLAAAGVPVPRGVRWEPGQPFPTGWTFPALLKPNDGAGSVETHVVSDASSAERLRALPGGARRLEEYCAGELASVMVLCGRRRQILLPPCRQRMSATRPLRYLGGSYPLPQELTTRACRLARAALAALPPTQGFVGVDIILGSAPGGAADVVLEVNPRLTTSYVGLRRATSLNLAAAMLAVQRGGRYPLFFHRGAVEF
jgi:predicted ATP-grasp superfamily ATP-dependent carboligase